MKGRIAIPIHNKKGELPAYAGRWPGGPPPETEPKYKLTPGFQFSLHRAIKGDPGDKLIVVEGFFDCFRIWETDFKNVIALMGSALSEEQEQLLTAQAKMVTLILDQDDAGMKATDEILSSLARRIFVRVVELPSPGNQPDRLEKEELVNLLKDI